MSLQQQQEKEVLIILLDLNSYYWSKFHADYIKAQSEAQRKGKPFEQLQIEEIIECITLHIFNHIGQSAQNSARLYRFDEVECKQVFPVNDMDKSLIKMMDFGQVREIIKDRILDYIDQKQLNIVQYSKIIQALGKSLCYLNKTSVDMGRVTEKGRNVAGKILIVFNSEVPNECFNQLMSCTFICQQRNWFIDCVTLNSKKHDYLLQASAKTKGLYFFAKNPTRGMMQYFMQVFNLKGSERTNFCMPYLTFTPFNSSCDCHNQKVDIAWICSRCLGVYCKKGKEACNGICQFCGVRFDLADFNQKLMIEEGSS